MTRIINKESLKKINVDNQKSDIVRIFKGGMEANKANAQVQTFGESMRVPMTGTQYEGSEGHARLWNEIEDLQKKMNAAQAPDADTLAALVGKIFIDVTRRSQEAGDLTSLFANEMTDLNAPEDVNLRNILDYVGKMETISGANDSVPLIEQNLAATDTVSMVIKATGWKTSLANILYNSLHTLEKVNRAVVNADTDARNGAIIGAIVGATFVASQKQAADATNDSTLDYKLYQTLLKAMKKLRGLKDNQTGRKIAVPAISILCNSVDSFDIQRVINGQLTNGGANGTLTTSNMQALPITNIIEYDQGITDGKTWGKETLDFPGVTAGKCYMFVPKEYLFVMNKRPLTMETGTGSVLQLSQEERAWYRVFGVYMKDFLGSSYPAAGTAGFGAIIEITLPS